MGVKGLTQLLQKFAPLSVSRRPIAHYKGKSLAVDVSCFLNRFIYGLDPHTARVQRGLYRLCIYLHMNGINPIFVFDGQGRIVEKRREGERRAALLTKVERSFTLEKERKSRLRGLKGSAQILKSLTPDQVSSILDDVRKAAGLQPKQDPSSGSEKQEKGGSPEATNSSLVAKDQSVLAVGPTWDDLNQDQADVEYEALVMLPTTMEDSDILLEKHLQDSKDIFEFNAGPYFPFDPASDRVIFEGDDDHAQQDDTVEAYDYDTVESQLEYGLDNLKKVLLLEYLATFTDPASTLQATMATTAETTHPTSPGPKEADILREEAEVLAKAIEDAYIRQRVHSALESFLHSMEQTTSPQELEGISTRRQRVLNALEHKLVQEIKESSKGGTRKQASVQSVDPEQTLAPPQNIVRSEEALENSIEPQAEVLKENTEKDPVEVVWQEKEDLLMTSREEEAVAKKDMKKADIENTGGVADNDEEKEDRDEEEEENIQSMIHGVLKEHQAVFMTLERRTMRVTRSLVQSCQEFLHAMGEPVIVAQEAEAEAVCAQLTTAGWTDGSVSEDTDTVVFGNGILLRQVGSGNKDVLEIDPVVARQQLGLNRDAFRDLCILCGTDFSGTIEGVGPIGAVKLIQYYGSIESILANTNHQPREHFLYDNARRVFDRPAYIPQDSTAYQSSPKIPSLLLELLLKYEIDPVQVREEILNEIEEAKAIADVAASAFGGVGAGTGKLSADKMGADPFQNLTIGLPEPQWKPVPPDP